MFLDSLVISRILKFADVETVISLRLVCKKFYKVSKLINILETKVVKEQKKLKNFKEIERLSVTNKCSISSNSFNLFTNLRYLYINYGKGIFDISLLPKNLTLLDLDWNGNIINIDKLPVNLTFLTLGESKFNTNIDLSNLKNLKTFSLWCKDFSSEIIFSQSLKEVTIYTESPYFKIPRLPTDIETCSFFFTKNDNHWDNHWEVWDNEKVLYNVDIDLTIYKKLNFFELRSLCYSKELFLPKSIKTLILSTESKHFKIPILPKEIENCSFLFTTTTENDLEFLEFDVGKSKHLKELTLLNGWNLINSGRRRISKVLTNNINNEILYIFE